MTSKTTFNTCAGFDRRNCVQFQSKICCRKDSFVTLKNDQGIHWKHLGTKAFRDSEKMKKEKRGKKKHSSEAGSQNH